MKPVSSSGRYRAVTLIEVVVVIAVVVVLVGLVLPALAPAKRKTKRLGCTNCLKQVGLAFRIFENDNDDTFPMGVSTNKGGTMEYLTTGQPFYHFRVMSNELSTPKVLVCPTDSRKPAFSFSVLSNVNLSYFVGFVTNSVNPQAVLGGDRNLMTNGVPIRGGLFVLTTNETVGWTAAIHQNSGNILLGDGSVQQTTSSRLLDLLRESGMATNRLAIP